MIYKDFCVRVQNCYTIMASPAGTRKRDNVGDIGQSASYMSEFTVGKGRVVQCTLNLAGDPAIGNYLIDTAAEYLLP